MDNAKLDAVGFEKQRSRWMDGWTDGLAGLCHYGAYLHFYLICRLKIWEIERKRDEKG